MMECQQDVIVVTGANGFIGRRVVKRLLAKQYRVRAFVRTDSTWPFPDHPLLERHTGNVTDYSSLLQALDGATGVVHLAAKKSDEEESEVVNVGGAKNLQKACEQTSVRWMINIGTQSSKLQSPGVYGATKKRADDVLKSSNIPVITLQLSLVYGCGNAGVFTTLVRLARLPITPIIGRGDAPFYPIFVDDVAEAIALLTEQKPKQSATFDVGGDEKVSLTEFLRLLKKRVGSKTPMVHIPTFALLWIARLLSVLPHPPVTVSNIRGAMEHIPMENESFRAATGFSPRRLVQGLDETFATPAYEDSEAHALLTYCMAPARKHWKPSERDLSNYKTALRTHNLAKHTIDGKYLSSRHALTALELASCFGRKRGILQKKLTIAAAIVEANPLSSDWLLPKDRSIFAIIYDGATTIMYLVSALPKACLLLLYPVTMQRNVGI